jgi:hypothetical protein
MADTVHSIKLMFMVGSATGAGWLFAILVLFQVGGAGVQYVFTVANAFQGCLIFTCHILLKEEGRLAFRKMKQSILSTSTGSASGSKNNHMTRGVHQQPQQRSKRLVCAWRSNVNGTRSTNGILTTCSLVSVECLDNVGRRRLTDYDDSGSVGDLGKAEVVYDVATPPPPTVYICMGGSRRSSTDYIDLEALLEESPLDPPALIRRSQSYSTAVAGEHCITVTTNTSAVRVSKR